jgi:Fe-S-cluster containining protein
MPAKKLNVLKDKDFPPDCSCESCQNRCKNRAGWFLPGEAEKAAALKGMTLEEFFKKYLAVDWWGVNKQLLVLAPVNQGPFETQPGGMYSWYPVGTCIFYIDGKCDIHEAKPYECKKAAHEPSPRDEADARHEAVAKAWKGHQDQPKQLLGYASKPE